MNVMLTHWGRMTHICVGILTIIVSDNGLSPGRRQAIIWTNDGILLIGPWGTNFSEILIGIHTFSFKKIHLKLSNTKVTFNSQTERFGEVTATNSAYAAHPMTILPSTVLILFSVCITNQRKCTVRTQDRWQTWKHWYPCSTMIYIDMETSYSRVLLL